MKVLGLILIEILIFSSQGYAKCDPFIALVEAAKTVYFHTHRIYPVPLVLQELAEKYKPQLWVHPDSWHPISFEKYLSQATLIRKSNQQVVKKAPRAQYLAKMSVAAQCQTYLEAPNIKSETVAPVYVQFFKDDSPGKTEKRWTYIKYNFIFDWSGLAQEKSLFTKIGAFFAGGKTNQWHRLDVHTAAILAFDTQFSLRALTLTQHNYQQTFLPGKDFPKDQAPALVAAKYSNELYLDQGENHPVSHRVVPFFTEVAFLIDPKQKPWFWAEDVTYGKNAGGQEALTKLVVLEPGHPLADFTGLLAPPNRILGMYVGRDGPPGYNYYALPDFIAMSDFVTLGFWKEGDLQLLSQIQPHLKDWQDTDWKKIVQIMRLRLKEQLP